MLPVVVYETLISLFNFYREGQVYQGMSCRQQIYKLVSTYTVEARLQAYTEGCDLSNQGNQVVITVSSQHYKVWVALRVQPIAQSSPSLESPSLESQSLESQPASAQANAAVDSAG
jgi:hypothetical protein